jgi:hypothetical protein
MVTNAVLGRWALGYWRFTRTTWQWTAHSERVCVVYTQLGNISVLRYCLASLTSPFVSTDNVMCVLQHFLVVTSESQSCCCSHLNFWVPEWLAHKGRCGPWDNSLTSSAFTARQNEFWSLIGPLDGLNDNYFGQERIKILCKLSRKNNTLQVCPHVLFEFLYTYPTTVVTTESSALVSQYGALYHFRHSFRKYAKHQTDIQAHNEQTNETN